MTFHAYTPQPEEVNIVEVSSGVPYRWKGIPGNPCSPRIRVFPHLKEKLKYKDNPAPVVNQKDKEGSWVQSLLAGGDYATYWKEVPGGKSRSVLYVSTANEVPASSLSLAKAMKTVEATQITGTKLLKQRHASGGMPTTNVLSFPFRTKTGELLFHTDVQTCHLFSSGWPGNGRNGHFLQTEPMAQFLVEPKYTTDLYAHRTSQ